MLHKLDIGQAAMRLQWVSRAAGSSVRCNSTSSPTPTAAAGDQALPFYKRIFKRRGKEAAVAKVKEDNLQRMAQEEQFYQQVELESREERIQRLRNKSRLSASDRRILKGQTPFIGLTLLESDKHREPQFKAKMLAKYGLGTDINPSVAWPSSEQIADRQEYERVLYDNLSLSEMIELNQRTKEQQRQEKMATEQRLRQNLINMKKDLMNLKLRIESKNRLAQEEQNRKARILAELREEFGYEVNPNDPQFADKIAEKEKAVSKQIKEEKKKQKLERKEQFQSEPDTKNPSAIIQ